MPSSPAARHRCSSAAVSGQPISESDFTSLASEAIRTGSVLDLSQRSVELKAPFKLGSDDVLRITGGTIFGSPHTLFQVQTSPKGLLELRGCELRHLPSAERSEKKTLGAALFARGRGRVALHDCTLASQAGFGVWLVQRAQAELHSCTVPRCGRSSVVAFEKARLDVRGSLLSDGIGNTIRVSLTEDPEFEIKPCSTLGSLGTMAAEEGWKVRPAPRRG